jgi:hypothetical protein
LRQELLLQHVWGGVAQQTAASHDGAQERLQQQSLPELFHHEHDVDSVAAQAPEVLGKWQSQQPEFRILAPGLGGIAQSGGGETAPLVKIVVA